MKHSKLLLIPLLFTLSSCVSITHGPDGRPFDPSNGQFGDDPKISYYDDNVLGDTIGAIPGDAKVLNFKNNQEHVDLYGPEDLILKDFEQHAEYVSSYQHKRVGKGIYAIKLDFDMQNQDNALTVNLKEGISARYVSINCCPAYYNAINNSGLGDNKYTYSCQDAAIKVLRPGELEHKYVKLKAVENKDPNDPEEIKKIPTMYDVTFDLGEAKNSFTINCYSWSVVINSITFF